MSERQRQVSGLTRKLVAEGIIEEASAVELDQEAKSANLPFVAYLVNEKGISAEKIATAAADEFTTPILDLDAFDTSALPEGIVSNELIRNNHAVPLFQRGNRLFVAVSDPTNRQALSDIQFQTGIATEEVLVREDQLSKFIQAHLEVDESSVFEGLDDDIDLDLETVDTAEEDEETTDSGIDDTPVVRFINKMLLDAIMQMKNEVSSGTQLADSMRAADLFPSMVVQMVAIGEESGALDSMLEKSASYYEEMVDTAVDGLTSLIEPFIMAFLAVVVGGMMVAMYLPIFQMGGAISG